MSSDIERWEPPNDATAFESLCLDLWKDIWRDSDAQKNGRRGQHQDGVDIFGHENGSVVGVQCKQKDGRLWAKVSPGELEAEVKAAQRFQPKLARFILATTASRDTAVQRRANQLTEQHKQAGLFTVAVWAWEDIWHELYRRKKLFESVAPIYWPRHVSAAFTSRFNSPHQLTPPVSDFTGREAKLDELRKKVKQGGVAITGVRGMGGAGKTALARRLAAELKADYPDAQIELDLKGVSAQSLSPADVLSAILRVFHPTAQLPERAEELAGLLRQRLDGRRALLLLDNAKDARQIAPLLTPPPGCLVLVTSRQHFALPGVDAVNLGLMEPPEARALLLKIAPRIGPEAEALAEACGRLPLALRLAASFLAVNEHIAPADYVRQLRDSRQRLQLLDRAQELTAEDLGLEASFTLSFQQIPPEQQQRFTQLAVFPTSFDSEAVAAVWAVEKSAASDALDLLLQLSLLEWNPQTQRFELHDLLREFARSRAEPEELDAAKRRHAEHFIRVARGADKLYMKGGENVLAGLALFDSEQGHLEAAFDWLELRGGKECALLLVKVVDAVVYTSGLRFHPRQHIRWLDAQAKAARLVGNRKAESTALGNLGPAYAALGDARKAIGFHEQALAIAREMGDRRGEGNALRNLGSAYAALGDARKAIEFHEQALVIDREIADRRGEGASLGNLGLGYADLGDARKAIGFHEQALAVVREIGDWRGEGNVLGNLGNVYADLGEARKAIEFYEQQLVIVREMGDRRGEGSALGNLGNVYADLGEARKAIDFYEEALTIRCEIGDRRGEGQDRGNLGVAYAALGDARKAIDFYEQALAIAREMGDRRGEGTALGNLGNAYADLGEACKAIESYEQQLVIVREMGDRRGEGTALWNSALALDKLGDRAQAITRAEAVLRICEAIEDPGVAKVRGRLAEWRKAGAGS
jgi:tetratricopeptide (TPR) repeat protein